MGGFKSGNMKDRRWIYTSLVSLEQKGIRGKTNSSFTRKEIDTAGTRITKEVGPETLRVDSYNIRSDVRTEDLAVNFRF